MNSEMPNLVAVDEEAAWLDRSEKLFNEQWLLLEKEFSTLARKLHIPGWTFDDVIQEYQIEVYMAARYWDGKSSKFRSFAWQRVLNKQADIVAKSYAQVRDVSKESYASPEVQEYILDRGNALNDHLSSVGNASRYFQILESDLGKIEKAVLILRAAGYNIKDTIDILRSSIAPEFDRKSYAKICGQVTSSDEVAAMVAA